MSTSLLTTWPAEPESAIAARGRAARRFALAALVVMIGACLLAGWAPLGFSMVTVFLFAGPHNWMEGRYMLGRMPARWGPLRLYYLSGIAGVLLLTGAFTALPAIARAWQWDGEQWSTGLAAWNTGLVGWIWFLAQLRSQQNPRRDWAWTTPLALAIVAVAWLQPRYWDLGLVYLHPLVALCFLDRELRLHRPEWSGAYRRLLMCLPLFLAALWIHLWGAPPLPGSDALSARITNHAGADLLPGISSHLLVATHTFLEMLHYSVWLVAIPLVGLRTAPWQIGQVPLARRSAVWRRGLAGLLILGAIVVVGFWAGFMSDYPLTRDLYFTVAMLHVLAEAPFLLRLL